MLDESLPTFFLKASKDNIAHNNTLYLAQHGSDAVPAYTLKRPDPASADSKNRYAVALYDCYNPDILYGEILSVPEWNQPTLSAEEIRKNSGVPPPPQPILPNDFTIQLYNPDQQIVVKNKPATWKENQFWEFKMPQQTFRLPSTSSLDRIQDDPTALESTPTINLRWKKEGKFSKDLMCYLSGRTENPDGSKKKQKEPDIPVAFFRNMRELTIYESNLQRVDVEDPKGFEVVLLLGAFAIRDIFFGQMAEIFNISEVGRQVLSSRRRGSSGAQKQQSPPQQPARYHRPTQSQPMANLDQNQNQTQRPVLSVQTPSSRPPPTDPRSQWELDAEAARLRKQQEQEEKERKKREKEDAKIARQIAEQEEKAARKQREAAQKQKEAADREHERLRQEYFAEQKRLSKSGKQPQLPPRHSAPLVQQPFQPPQQYMQQGPYLQAPVMSGASTSQPYLQAPGPSPQQVPKPKKSGFFGLRSKDEKEQRLLKKQSAIF